VNREMSPISDNIITEENSAIPGIVINNVVLRLFFAIRLIRVNGA